MLTRNSHSNFFRTRKDRARKKLTRNSNSTRKTTLGAKFSHTRKFYKTKNTQKLISQTQKHAHKHDITFIKHSR